MPGTEIEIRQVFEAEDFGPSSRPSWAAEEKMRPRWKSRVSLCEIATKWLSTESFGDVEFAVCHSTNY